MAGESASEMARRKREKAARLTRDAELWEKGAVGEEATARTLAQLPAGQWHALHDVRWPGRQRANIDHVVVGPGGVFVIDSKNWSGRVDVRDGILRQNGSRREREVAAVADSALAVAEVMGGAGGGLVKPVLCLVSNEPIIAMSRDVLVCSTATLVQQLSVHPVVLHPVGVTRTFDRIRWILTSAQRSNVPANKVAWSRPPGPSSSRRAPARSASISGRAAAAVGSALGGILLIIFGIVALASLVDDLGAGNDAASGADRGAETVEEAVVDEWQLGDTVGFPRATGRPPLEVTARRFVTTKVTAPDAYLFGDNRWVAVQVSVHNTGARAWRSQPGTKWELVGEYGIAGAQGQQLASKAGKPLRLSSPVPPGKTVRGWVLFQTEASRPVTGVTLTVGPGEPHEATWVVDRQ